MTRADIAAYLEDEAPDRDVERTARELQRLGWIAALHLKGAWVFFPPGESDVVDPYVDLRAWRARDPGTTFALAGEAAAWHLGYLDRAFDGTPAVWVPEGVRLPHGLRPHVSALRLGWGADVARRLGPSSALLHRRHLDLTAWAGGLRAFGPEALIVQLAARPSSFRVWADLVANLGQLATDTDTGRLSELLAGQSSSAWQRAAYLLNSAGRHDLAVEVIDRRPPGKMHHVTFGDGEPALFSPEFGVTDRLIAVLQGIVTKS